MSTSKEYWKLWREQVFSWPLRIADIVAFLLWLGLFQLMPEGHEKLIWLITIIILVILFGWQFVFAPSRIYTRVARQWEKERAQLEEKIKELKNELHLREVSPGEQLTFIKRKLNEFRGIMDEIRTGEWKPSAPELYETRKRMADFVLACFGSELADDLCVHYRTLKHLQDSRDYENFAKRTRKILDAFINLKGVHDISLDFNMEQWKDYQVKVTHPKSSA